MGKLGVALPMGIRHHASPRRSPQPPRPPSPPTRRARPTRGPSPSPPALGSCGSTSKPAKPTVPGASRSPTSPTMVSAGGPQPGVPVTYSLVPGSPPVHTSQVFGGSKLKDGDQSFGDKLMPLTMVFWLGVAEDYEQLVEDIVRDGRLYASENHQEILKVSMSPPGPRCPGLWGCWRAGASLPSGVAPVRSWLWFGAAAGGARGGVVTPPPPIRLGFPPGQEAHQSFLRRAGAPPELLQVHGETQGDAAPLLHQTPPLQSLQLPPALQIAPRVPAAPRSQGKPLLPSFSFPIFSFLCSAPAGSPPLAPHTSPPRFLRRSPQSRAPGRRGGCSGLIQPLAKPLLSSKAASSF